MTDHAVQFPPLWLRLLRSPLVRLIVLGGAVFFLMGWTQARMNDVHHSPAAEIAVAFGMGLLAMAIYWAYGHYIERREVKELSLPGMFREWAVGAGVGASLYTGCVVILMVLGIYRIDGLNPWAYLTPAIAMAIKSGIFEELLFRGVLFRSVEDMFGSWVSIVVSSLIFGFLHLLNPEATIGGAVYISIEAGLLLAAAYMVTRRLWLCMGFHMAWNYVQSAVFSGTVSGGVADPGLIRDTIVGPDLLTGGSFGMEQSIFALVLCTSAGAILLRMAIRRGHVRQAFWNR